MASGGSIKKTKKKFDTIKNIQEDFLTCGICLEYFINPKSLACLHKFCEGCLQVYVDKKETKPEKNFQCPMKCKEQTILPSIGINGLKTDFMLKGLDEFLSVKENERRSDRRSVHDVFSEVVCSEHTSKLCELFCEEKQCQVPICIKCISGAHNGHKVAEIETLMNNAKVVITDLIKMMEDEISIADKKEEIFQRFINKADETLVGLTASVDNHAEDIIAQVKQTAEQIKDKIRLETESQKATFETLLDDSRNRADDLTCLTSDLKRAQHSSSLKDLLQIKQESQLKIKMLRKEPGMDPVKTSSMTIENNVDLLGPDLIQLIMKDKNVTVKSAYGGVTVEETVTGLHEAEECSDESTDTSTDEDDDDDEY